MKQQSIRRAIEIISEMDEISFDDLKALIGDRAPKALEMFAEAGLFLSLRQDEDGSEVWDGALTCTRVTRVGDPVPGDGGTELFWSYQGWSGPCGETPARTTSIPLDAIFDVQVMGSEGDARMSEDEQFAANVLADLTPEPAPERKAPTLRTAITSVLGNLPHEQQRSFLETLQAITNEHATSEAFGAETAYELVDGLHDACYDAASDEVTGW